MFEVFRSVGKFSREFGEVSGVGISSAFSIFMNKTVFFLLLFLGPSTRAQTEMEGVSKTSEESSFSFDDAALWLAGIEGLELVEHSNGKVVLSGKLERPSDLAAVQFFLKKYPEVIDKTRFSGEALRRIEKYLRQKLREKAPEANLRREGMIFKIAGSSDQIMLLELQKYYPNVHFVRERAARAAAIAPTVFLEVALVEVKKTALHKLGMRLNSPIAFDTRIDLSFLKNSSRQVTSSTLDPVRLFLDLAMQHGEARVLAKQSVVTQDGKLGEFKVGGEFPVKVVSGVIARVDFKEFGLILKFTPHLQAAPFIHLEIDSEVSDIDTGSMVDGIPVVFQKKLKTQLYTRLDEMIAIGGMVRASTSKGTDEIPGLSAVPGLGRLFRSEDFKKHKSEAYIFITPKKMERAWLPSPEL